jgi:hypothetical protein
VTKGEWESIKISWELSLYPKFNTTRLSSSTDKIT